MLIPTMWTMNLTMLILSQCRMFSVKQPKETKGLTLANSWPGVHSTPSPRWILVFKSIVTARAR